MKKRLTKAERNEIAAEIERSMEKVKRERPLRNSRRKYFPRNDEELLLLREYAAAEIRAGCIREV